MDFAESPFAVPEQSSQGYRNIGQHGPYFTARTMQHMLVLLKISVLLPVQTVLHLPMAANQVLKFRCRNHGRIVHKFGERGLETIKREFSQNTCQSNGIRNFSLPLFVLKFKELTELRK